VISVRLEISKKQTTDYQYHDENHPIVFGAEFQTGQTVSLMANRLTAKTYCP
jgi:hypothetical protein